jgi:hypothetical protein
LLLVSDKRNNLTTLQEQVVVITPERRQVGLVLVRFHWRKNSILECLSRRKHIGAFNTYKKAVGSSCFSPNGLLAGEKWREKEKPQAKRFRITHGLSI